MMVLRILIISYFLCPLFNAQRATLASSVIEILQKYILNHLGNQSNLYLYGHQTVNFADNRKVLLSAIKFIKEMFLNVRLFLHPHPHPDPSPPPIQLLVLSQPQSHDYFVYM